MKKEKIVGLGLTFDDVLLIPGASDVLPREVSLNTRLTRNITLAVPLVSAAMDTVTEADMAIAMARAGGIGILHKNMPINRQCAEIEKVKNLQVSGLINKPLTVKPVDPIGELAKKMKESNIHTFPVVSGVKELFGLISLGDIKFDAEKNPNGMVQDYMKSLADCITISETSSYEDAKKLMQEKKVDKLPVLGTDNKLVGLYTWKDIHMSEKYPLATRDENGKLRVGVAVSINSKTLQDVEKLVSVGVDVICVDSAHGHHNGVLNTIKSIRTSFPDLQIIGGNVATTAGAQALIDAGVDAVKVGVGPGSICTTRIVAGVGVPQLSAIMFAAEACSKANVPLIADGGIRYTGDIAKAIAAGADCIMAGSIFAGTEESPGDTILSEGRKFKTYRGMGSVDAMSDGSKDRYFQDVEDDIKKLVPEGIVGRVPFKGHVAEVIYQQVGGLRASMGYCGAKDIKELKNSQFIQITVAGIKESHPHDVVITKESPNYSK